MVKNIVLILIFGWIYSTVYGQIDIFKEANLSYNRGDYQRSIDLYASIYRGGFESAELFYNLGHAHYDMGHIGKAILFFEKALRLDALHSESKLALDLVEKEVKIQITEIPDFIVLRWYKRLINANDSNSWAFFQLVSGIIFLVLIFYTWFRADSYLTHWYSISILTLLLSISCLVFSIKKKRLESGGNAAIVLYESTYLYRAADDRSPVLSDLGEGVKVYIIDQIENWFKVELKDKDLGWVKKEKVEII